MKSGSRAAQNGALEGDGGITRPCSLILGLTAFSEKVQQGVGSFFCVLFHQQWPVFFRTTICTLVPTNLTCCPRASPRDFSPPIESTGMVSLFFESSAKSFAV